MRCRRGSGVWGRAFSRARRPLGPVRLLDAVAAAHLAAQIDAAHPWQHHVQQNQVGLRLSEQLDRLFGGTGGQHRLVISAEVLHEETRRPRNQADFRIHKRLLLLLLPLNRILFWFSS